MWSNVPRLLPLLIGSRGLLTGLAGFNDDFSAVLLTEVAETANCLPAPPFASFSAGGDKTKAIICRIMVDQMLCK